MLWRTLESESVSCSAAAAAAKSLQSCPTLWDPIDGSPPGSPVPGILQARTLEWVAISFSSAWKWKVKVKSLSRIGLFPTPWTAAYQVAQSCPILCNAKDCSLPGSPVHGILQARTLVWVAIPFPRGSSWPRDQTWVSCTAGSFFTTELAGSP